jgi:hypothetical protein
VWRVKRASSESSTPGPDEPKINWANGGVPLTDSKLRAITERKTDIYLIFPFQPFISCINHV